MLKMETIEKLTKKHLRNIKMIVFDVDGVLVPRGTKIKQRGNTIMLAIKVIQKKEIEQMRKLNKKGFLINISSGRGLYMLQEMFREVLPFVSLTYENGSATWYQGKIYQHVNSFKRMEKVFPKLKRIASKNIKGFEPKEFIITIHCTTRVKEIEEIVRRERGLYIIWNGEAYDIGMKKKQTKAVGLRQVIKIFKLGKKNIMAIGDNYNDYELFEETAIDISADKSRIKGDFYVPLKGKCLLVDNLIFHVPLKGGCLPADNVMQKILSLR